MAYWNHFAEHKYQPVDFKNLSIGDKFRKDFFKKGRRRKDVICIKTGDLSFIEEKSKQEHKLHHMPPTGFEVRAFGQ